MIGFIWMNKSRHSSNCGGEETAEHEIKTTKTTRFFEFGAAIGSFSMLNPKHALHCIYHTAKSRL